MVILLRSSMGQDGSPEYSLRDATTHVLYDRIIVFFFFVCVIFLLAFLWFLSLSFLRLPILRKIIIIIIAIFATARELVKNPESLRPRVLKFLFFNARQIYTTIGRGSLKLLGPFLVLHCMHLRNLERA